MRLSLLTALAVTAFAANSALNRAGVASGAIDAASFATIRTLSAALLLGALIAARGTRPAWPGLFAPLMLSTYLVGFSQAYLTLDTGLGALILFGTVQVTMIALAPAFGMGRAGGRQLAGAALALIGLAVLLAPGPVAVPPFGAAAMIAAGAGWGVYSLLGRRSRDPLGATAANFALALPLVALAQLPTLGTAHVTATGAVLATVAGAVTSGLGYALWYRVLPSLAPAVAATAQMTVPLIAAAMGALILAEVPGPRFALAAALVAAGVALSVHWPPRPARANCPASRGDRA
ncbi:MAG: EamA family transporter [Paracoccaceae bacterium]